LLDTGRIFAMEGRTMSERITEAELAEAEQQALKQITVYMGEWSRTAEQVKTAFAEVRRRRALIVAAADGMGVQGRVRGPLGELQDEAEAIRAESKGGPHA
jgi:transposase